LADDQSRTAHDELYVYTMGRPGFILQHVVDAYAAQTATLSTKPMGLVFALVGLYLHVERGFSGDQVQRVHMRLAKARRNYPPLTLPASRGAITPVDVLASPAGVERDAAIDRWCASVWEAFRESRQTIVAFLRDCGID
jgi:Family of unknown function (DUF5946)